MFTLWAKVDYPPQQKVFKFASTGNVGELKTAASAAVSVDASRYSFFIVNYLSDVIALVNRPDSDILADIGVKDRASVFVRAPSDMKPPAKNRLKDKEVKKADDDKYAGLTPATIFQKLKSAKPKQKQLYLEYVDIYMAKIIKTPGTFTKLDEKTVVLLCKRDTLSVKEVELFEAVYEWGTAECKRQKKDADPANIKSVLQNVLPCIRFPVMSSEDVATRVAAKGVLDPEMILALFTYLGQESEDIPLPEALKGFPKAKRKGRKPLAWFKFEDTKKHAQLQCTPDGLMITSNNTSYYQPIFGNIELKEGIHEWEFLITQMYSHSYSLNVGVVPASFSNWTLGNMIGYPGHIFGWAYAAGHGYKYNNNQVTYGRTCVSGDVVRVRLDLDKKPGTLEFFVNGASQGIAYTDVTAPVRPAISLYGNTSVTLRFPST